MEEKYEFKSINSSIYSVGIYSSLTQKNYSLFEAVAINSTVNAESDSSPARGVDVVPQENRRAFQLRRLRGFLGGDRLSSGL